MTVLFPKSIFLNSVKQYFLKVRLFAKKIIWELKVAIETRSEIKG